MKNRARKKVTQVELRDDRQQFQETYHSQVRTSEAQSLTASSAPRICIKFVASCYSAMSHALGAVVERQDGVHPSWHLGGLSVWDSRGWPSGMCLGSRPLCRPCARVHAANRPVVADPCPPPTPPPAQLGVCRACGTAPIDDQCQAPNTNFRVCSASRPNGKTDFLSLTGNTAGCKFAVDAACTAEACDPGTFCVDLTVSGWRVRLRLPDTWWAGHPAEPTCCQATGARCLATSPRPPLS